MGSTSVLDSRPRPPCGSMTYVTPSDIFPSTGEVCLQLTDVPGDLLRWFPSLHLRSIESGDPFHGIMR